MLRNNQPAPRLAKAGWLIPALSSVVFLLSGLALLPYPGLQNDELFFAGPLYDPGSAFYWVHLGAAQIPLMVLSYLGTLKTGLYAGLFQFFSPGIWSVRLPVLGIGIVTIWLTWAWARRIAGVQAASVTTVLLATDTSFLLTNTFDWGPVALQHVLLMGGLVAIQRWLQTPSNKRLLALGFFLWGLGMWDKALLIWPLIGLAVACFCVFPLELLKRLRVGTVTVAALAFLVGAAPLVIYNIDQPGATASTNTHFTTDGLSSKVEQLRRAIDGTALYGYIVTEDPGPATLTHRTLPERAAAWVDNHSGNHRQNGLMPACLLALVCLVSLWKKPVSRLLIFLLIVMVVEWLQMAFTQNTGGGTHHVILIWPFPLVFIGIAYSAAADRIPRFGVTALTMTIALLAAGNLLTTNRYFVDAFSNGSTGGWTDAIYPLARSLEGERSAWIGLVDWGCLTPLQVLDDGDLQLYMADAKDRAELKKNLSAPNRLFVQHTEDKQMIAGVNDRFRQAVAELGYEEQLERVVYDRFQRPVFEVFRVKESATRR